MDIFLRPDNEGTPFQTHPARTAIVLQSTNNGECGLILPQPRTLLQSCIFRKYLEGTYIHHIVLCLQSVSRNGFSPAAGHRFLHFYFSCSRALSVKDAKVNKSPGQIECAISPFLVLWVSLAEPLVKGLVAPRSPSPCLSARTPPHQCCK